jgi:hypothetical protein
MTHLEIVRLLVHYHADIQRPNYNGGTCLINSVQSVQGRDSPIVKPFSN